MRPEPLQDSTAIAAATSVAATPPSKPPDDAARAAELTRALTYLILIGVLAAAGWAYREGFYRGLPFPHNTFLFSPGDHFRDLLNFYLPLRAHDPYSYTYAVYPPFTYIAMEPFQWLDGTRAVVLWTVLTAGGLGFFVERQLRVVPPIDRAAAVVAMTVATYPFLFSFDRGNIESLVTLMLAVVVWALPAERVTLAALAVGVAAGLKGYPLIFAALFLARRQWRALAVAVVTTVLLTFLGSIFYSFDLPHTIDLLRDRLSFYNTNYVIGDAGLGWGCSLFGAVKILLVDGLGGDADTVRSALHVYAVATALIGLGIVAALWRLPMLLWEQVALLTIALNTLPTVSADYKLLHLVIPMALFLRQATHDPWRWFYLLGFAALMVPKAYILLRPDGTNLGVVVDPLIMAAIGIAIVVSAARRRRVAQPSLSPLPA